MRWIEPITTWILNSRRTAANKRKIIKYGFIYIHSNIAQAAAHSCWPHSNGVFTKVQRAGTHRTNRAVVQLKTLRNIETIIRMQDAFQCHIIFCSLSLFIVVGRCRWRVERPKLNYGHNQYVLRVATLVACVACGVCNMESSAVGRLAQWARPIFVWFRFLVFISSSSSRRHDRFLCDSHTFRSGEKLKRVSGRSVTINCWPSVTQPTNGGRIDLFFVVVVCETVCRTHRNYNDRKSK